MNSFKTRFNYVIPICRFIFSIFFAGLSLILIYLIIEDLKSNGFSADILFALIFNIISIYISYLFAYAIIKQSYNFIFEEGNIYKISIFSSKRELLKINEFKGFSTSEYPLKIWNFKSIILYFQNGQKIELPQFLYFNFSKIENMLIENEITKFGHEKHKWKSITSREYKFE